MAKDKFKAVWVSHSSINDFLNCPRAYYLRNIYKDPRTGHKVTEMKPQLSLGQLVHEVLEQVSLLPVDERLKVDLTTRLDLVWHKISGKKGGFKDQETEDMYKKRAYAMLQRVQDNPGILLNKAIKLKSENGLSSYWLSEEENIILCGKVDWIEYLENSDSIHILDFKTGKNEEGDGSLQLPIYELLATNLQTRKIEKISYWYLESSNTPSQVNLMDIKEAENKVMEVAKRIKLARQINYFKCPKGEGGCFACKSLERIINGEGELVALSEYKQDIYLL